MEMQKLMEKKQQFRMELNEQVQEKEEIRKQEKQLKHIECNDFKILNAKLIEEEEFGKHKPSYFFQSRRPLQ